MYRWYTCWYQASYGHTNVPIKWIHFRPFGPVVQLALIVWPTIFIIRLNSEIILEDKLCYIVHYISSDPFSFTSSCLLGANYYLFKKFISPPSLSSQVLAAYDEDLHPKNYSVWLIQQKMESAQWEVHEIAIISFLQPRFLLHNICANCIKNIRNNV